ncbi:hypothetical protein DPMN_123931 [Dreissena polymorpha]|uniref:Uncharacterized protein n=1 Tax=Dreissena polymorpha TaxID=45954 RepID=A0A9D4GSA3_DREPO|nr:hypothetical protein DPMN_123931 [Dreissena polymorpha]
MMSGLMLSGIPIVAIAAIGVSPMANRTWWTGAVLEVIFEGRIPVTVISTIADRSNAGSGICVGGRQILTLTIVFLDLRVFYLLI